MAKRIADEFFKTIPRGAMIVFLAGVFFIFAPVGLLFVSSFAEARPMGATLFIAFLSGAVGVSWAATFTVSRWFVPAIVVTTALLMAFSGGPFQGSALGARISRTAPETLFVVAAVVLGYVLFVVFISGQGRTTLRLMTEMTLARGIHETLVPRIDRTVGRVKILGVSLASSEMGGDLIDLVERDEATDLVLADVSGHGVKAGVVMGMVKASLRTALLRPRGLEPLLADLHEVLEATTSTEMYATCAALRIDREGRNAECALAGHHQVVRVRANGGIERIGESNPPLGLFGTGSYATERFELSPGDLLALYTDGLNETRRGKAIARAGDDPEELGHARIESFLAQNVAAPLEELQRGLFELVESFGSHDDDRTLLLVRVG